MRYLILAAALLLPVSALAQQPPPQPVPPNITLPTELAGRINTFLVSGGKYADGAMMAGEMMVFFRQQIAEMKATHEAQQRAAPQPVEPPK